MACPQDDSAPGRGKKRQLPEEDTDSKQGGAAAQAEIKPPAAEGAQPLDADADDSEPTLEERVNALRLGAGLGVDRKVCVFRIWGCLGFREL